MTFKLEPLPNKILVKDFEMHELKALQSTLIRDNLPIDFSSKWFNPQDAITILKEFTALGRSVHFNVRNEMDIARNLAHEECEKDTSVDSYSYTSGCGEVRVFDHSQLAKKSFSHIIQRGNLDLIAMILNAKDHLTAEHVEAAAQAISNGHFYIPESARSEIYSSATSSLVKAQARFTLDTHAHDATHGTSDYTNAHSFGFSAPDDTHGITGDSVVTAGE